MALKQESENTSRSKLSSAVEDYAKVIYSLQEDRTDGVPNSAIAERLEVSTPSVSAMIKKMGDLGLVSHERYGTVLLTRAGEKVALEVIRHHRLLELYLSEDLGLPWDRVHDEAEVLEHVLSEELEQLIAEKLGNPTRDPHGNPIPTSDLKLKLEDSVSMHRLPPGARGTFVEICDSRPEMLRYLDSRGIALGEPFEVVSKDPFDGPLYVRFNDTIHALGGELTRAMRAGRPAR